MNTRAEQKRKGTAGVPDRGLDRDERDRQNHGCEHDHPHRIQEYDQRVEVSPIYDYGCQDQEEDRRADDERS